MNKKATICVGVSASRKSSWAEEFTRNRDDWIEINRDDIRFDTFCGEARDWSKYKWKHEKKVTEIVNNRIQLASDSEMNIIISDTNLNKKYRDILINKLESLGYEVEIKEFEVDYEEAVRRDKLRANSVGREVIYKQYLQWLEYKGFEKYVPNNSLPVAVIFDVDGTVSNSKNIRGPFEWGKTHLDEPIWQVIAIANGLYEIGYEIVFLSGRDACCYEKTKQWLERYFRFPIELYMRAEGDMRKDYIIKKELFDTHVKDKYDVDMVVDDRPQVIELCWNPMGIKVINVGNVLERF